MFKKLFSLSLLVGLFALSPSKSLAVFHFGVPAQNMFTGSDEPETSGCAKEAPDFQCCTNSAGTSCETPWRKCGTIGLNSDCTNGSFPTCAPKNDTDFTITDLEGVYMLCDPAVTTSKRRFFIEHHVPLEAPSAPKLKCRLSYTSIGDDEVNDSYTFKVYAVAVNSSSTTSPAIPNTGGCSGACNPQDIVEPVAANSNYYELSAVSGDTATCIQDGAEAGTCCTGTECHGRDLKVMVEMSTYTDGGTANITKAKIRYADCEFFS